MTIRPAVQFAFLVALTLLLWYLIDQVKIFKRSSSLMEGSGDSSKKQMNKKKWRGDNKKGQADAAAAAEHDTASFTWSLPSISVATSDQQNSCLSISASNPILRNVHIVMMGDSVMRYQYLSLVYRLRHGVWFHDSQWYYHLVNQRTFQDPFHDNIWGAFLYHSNLILHPYEVCDCRHKPVVVENRYYYDPIHNNSVVYLLAYGHAFSVAGQLRPPDVVSRYQNRTWQMQSFREFGTVSVHWNYSDWSDVLLHYVRHLQPPPRHVVMNAGIWFNYFGWSSTITTTPPRLQSNETSSQTTTTTTPTNTKPVLSNDTIRLLHAVRETPQFQYVWRTTTFNDVRRNKGAVTDKVMCEHFHICVNVSFTQRVRKELYWDNIHFYEPVYRALNEELLSDLGYLPSDYVRMNLLDILEPTTTK